MYVLQGKMFANLFFGLLTGSLAMSWLFTGSVPNDWRRGKKITHYSHLSKSTSFLPFLTWYSVSNPLSLSTCMEATWSLKLDKLTDFIRSNTAVTTHINNHTHCEVLYYAHCGYIKLHPPSVVMADRDGAGGATIADSSSASRSFSRTGEVWLSIGWSSLSSVPALLTSYMCPGENVLRVRWRLI